MDRFAFTVKDNRKDVTDYEPLFDSWIKKGLVINCKYLELDSYNRMHYHGIVTIPKKVYRKSLCPTGFHFLLKEISDEEGWMTYIKKDQPLDDEDTDDNDCLSRLKHSLFTTPTKISKR